MVWLCYIWNEISEKKYSSCSVLWLLPTKYFIFWFSVCPRVVRVTTGALNRSTPGTSIKHSSGSGYFNHGARPPQPCSPCVSHLPLHVHDHHWAGAVAHHKLLRVLGQKEYVVDHDVYSSGRAWRLECTVAFASLHIPNLRGRSMTALNLFIITYWTFRSKELTSCYNKP